MGRDASTISHESIYRFIYRSKVHKEKLQRFLARTKAIRGPRYFKRRREPIPGRRSIHERPQAVEWHQEFGHWEGNLLQFRTQRGNLLTPIERVTRLTLAAPLKTKTTEVTDRHLRAIFQRLPLLARRSITFVNGSEFPKQQNLSRTFNMKTWFCDPHSHWQHDSVENANGVLRRDLSRKTDLADYRQQGIHDIAWTINTAPRKCLGLHRDSMIAPSDQPICLDVPTGLQVLANDTLFREKNEMLLSNTHSFAFLLTASLIA